MKKDLSYSSRLAIVTAVVFSLHQGWSVSASPPGQSNAGGNSNAANAVSTSTSGNSGSGSGAVAQPLPVECEFKINPAGVAKLNDLSGLQTAGQSRAEAEAYLSALFDQRYSAELPANRADFNSSQDPARTAFRLFCRTSSSSGNLGGVRVRLARQGLPVCSVGISQGACLEYQGAASQDVDLGSSAQALPGLDIVVRNAGTSAAQVASSAFKVEASLVASNPAFETKAMVLPQDSASDELRRELRPALNLNSFCAIAISGAREGAGVSVPCLSADCQPPVTKVANGQSRLKVILSGTAPWQREARSVEWAVKVVGQRKPELIGEGFYSVQPSIVEASQYQANVVTRSGKALSCAVKVQAEGKGLLVNVQAGADCSFFSALKKYYLPLTPTASRRGQAPVATPKTTGNEIEFTYGNEKFRYGVGGRGEVPVVRGILNGAMSAKGGIVASAGGKYTLPPRMSDRAFAAGVVNVYELDQATKQAGRIVYQGLVDYQGTRTDWSRVELRPVGGGAGADTDQLVLQIFLAKDFQGGVYEFKPSGTDVRTGKVVPKDYLVPLMNESCSPASYFSFPPRTDNNDMPVEIRASTLCPYSAPFERRLLVNGNVRVSALGIVPAFHGHEFPTELLRRSSRPACAAASGSAPKACWVINGSTAPKRLTGEADVFSNHKSCEIWEYVTSTYTYACGYQGRETCTGTSGQWVFKGYVPGCPVLEGSDECGKGLAVRFAGYEQMAMASLGCSVKLDRPGFSTSGMEVSSTLPNQGIIPYNSSFGGGQNGTQKVFNSSSSPKGYGCIPCRFGADLSASDPKPIPVDQTVGDVGGDQPRRPVFNFVKSEAPAECVRTQTVEVRYFGSEACDGFNAPAGHMCTSGNIGNTRCPAPGHRNQNVAGVFQVDVCPDGGFEFDKIAVSWSPLVVDVVGQGIHVSRAPQLSVAFDIKGNGKQVQIDWPMNTHEAAFLVLPDRAGEVKSIRELFGDFKAANGFESLRSRLDSNRDGSVDSRDKKFAQLRLWFDRNRNGVAEHQELESLQDHGVTSISLLYDKPQTRGIEGQSLKGTYFNTLQNRFMNVEDIYFYEYKADGSRIEPEAKTKK